MTAQRAKRVAGEAIGTALLLAAVVGSGIMAQRLAGGNVAIALLCNTIATGAALTILILIFGPLSGAHFNPAVVHRLPLAANWHGAMQAFTSRCSLPAELPACGWRI